MATKDEIKSLLEAEIGPLKAKLTSIEKSFFELEKSVKHFSAKYDELLKQVQRSNDRTASLSTDVKNLKEDMKQCKKIEREIEDLSQYLRRYCLELTGVLPTEEVSCVDLVCSIGKEMGIELQDEDISTAHCLPTYNKSAEDKIIVKFTRRSIRDEFYGKRKLNNRRQRSWYSWHSMGSFSRPKEEIIYLRVTNTSKKEIVWQH